MCELCPHFLLGAGCSSEVPFCSGGSNGETRRAGEENRQSCGGLETLLGGTESGEAGEVPCRSSALPAAPNQVWGASSDFRVHRQRVEA